MPGTSGPRTIISVFPMEQRLQLLHEGIKTYEIEAAERGSYKTLTVNDTYAWCRNFHVDKFSLYAAPVSAAVVADNLIQRWSTGMVGTKEGLGPGVMVCVGLEPTEAEIATVNARQEEYFRYLINEADALYQKAPGDVTSYHRLAAEWMGAHDRPWFKPIAHIDMVKCIACAEEIRSEAKICRWCHSNQADFRAKEARQLATK